MGNFEKLSLLVIVVIAVMIGVVVAYGLSGDESVGTNAPTRDWSVPVTDGSDSNPEYVTGSGLSYLDKARVFGDDALASAPTLLEVPWGRAKEAIVILIGGDENHLDTAEAISVTRGYGSTYSEDINTKEVFRIKEFAGRLRLLPVR